MACRSLEGSEGCSIINGGIGTEVAASGKCLTNRLLMNDSRIEGHAVCVVAVVSH